MSSSRFRLIEDNVDQPLTLFVRPDGTVTPDKDTVKELLSNCSSMDINLMTMKKVEAGEVNIIMDTLTYVNQDDLELDEIARNVYNFKMDHDYTPLSSPTHVSSGQDMVDELAQTLSMLEDGSLDPQYSNEPLTKITKIVNGTRQTIFVNSKEKQRMINAGLLKEKATEKVFKKPKPLQTVPVASTEPPALVPVKTEVESKQNVKAATKSIKKVEKNETEPVDDKKLVVKDQAEKTVSTDIVQNDKKPLTPQKKEKKKQNIPIPDDMALFSTPDIIRRVGTKETNDKSPPGSSSPTKPAKISPESRSKSNSEKKRQSAEERTPSLRRMSLDTKNLLVNDTFAQTPGTTPLDIKDNKSKDEQMSEQDFCDSSDAITDDQLEPLPSAEDIRAMIHSESKSFTISSVLTEADHEQHDDDSAANLNIDASSLELDQSILDNINTDLISEDILYQVAQSLVDNNTELQNVIDKSLTDGNLVLDTGTAGHLQETDTLDSLNVSVKTKPDDSLSSDLQQSDIHSTAQGAVLSGGTQIVRPDGRIVVIPPIERPTTRSRNKKSLTPAPPQSKSVHKPLDDQHVSGDELDSSTQEEEEEDDDDDGESDDDPNKLWCVCNQPHNNRFMICCDTCEEWYHGKCVNVTKAMGHTMEQQGKEWMCVYCKDPALKRPAAALRRIRKGSRTSTESSASTVKSKQSNTSKTSSSTKRRVSSSGSGKKEPVMNEVDTDKGKKETEPEPTPTPTSVDKKPGCVVCGKPSRSSSIYCSDQCILKHAQGVEKVIVFNRKSGQLLTGSNAPSASNLDKWLQENPAYEAVRSSNKVVAKIPKSSSSGQLTQSKLKLVKNVGSTGVSLAVQKKGVNIGVLPHSPKAQSNSNNKPIILNSALKNKQGNVQGLKIVSKQSILQVQRSEDNQAKLKVGATSTPQKILNKTPVKVATPVATKREVLPQKTPKARAAESSHQPKQENLRETVRKTFFEQLSNRLKNVDDLKLSDDELKAVSDEIESQLYRCFADTGQKYRNKYRSLIFNIKDAKNQTLWRRICEKSVNPYQLVRLSHDDLASQELALWRERETKHQLDMIKKSELELLNCSRQYVFKTHKGETVFEDDRGKDGVNDVLANPVPELNEAEDDDKKRDKDKDRKLSKDSKRRSKSKDRDKKKRSRSRDRSRHSDRERRRSRSRDRHRDRDRERERRHKSSRHKKEEEKKEKTINTEKLDKKSKEILEQLVDKQIVPPLEDKLWKTEEPVQTFIPEPVVPATQESDSDNEPSSTVTIPTPPRVPEVDDGKKQDIESDPDNKKSEDREILFKGALSMIDVARVDINAYEVTGDCAGLGEELPKTLEIVGRISPNTVWDYIGKMKTSNSKTIAVIQMIIASPTNSEEQTPYKSLYTYLSSRQRLGVVKCLNKRVKDFYVLPLAANSSIPDALLPITGPGFGEKRQNLLVGVVVRDIRKRPTEPVVQHGVVKRIRVEVRGSTPPPPSTSRSYTPPPCLPRVDPRVNKLPVPSVDVPEEAEEDMDEPYSPADSDPDSMQGASKQLNSSDLTSLLSGGVKASSFLDTGITSMPTNFEPFANKFEGIPGLDVESSNKLEIKQKLSELDEMIAAQKAEIDMVSKNLVSSSVSGSSANSDLESSSLANIALPSNLHQILASIKSIGSKGDTPEYQPETASMGLSGSSTDLTIPLMLPKLSSRSVSNASPSSNSPVAPIPSIPLTFTVPPPKIKPDECKSSGGGVLSSLSEADLIKKAAEMLGEVEPPAPSLKRHISPPAGNLNKKGRLEMNQPPIPGLED